MKILLKKDGSGKSYLEIPELSNLLKIDELLNKITLLEEEVNTLKNETIDRQTIIDLLSNNNAFNINQPINITSTSAIETIANIPNGVLYFDAFTEKFRYKSNDKWLTLK